MPLFSKSLALALGAASLASFSPRLVALEHAKMLGHVASSQQVDFDVYLGLQHRDELDTVLAELHNPASANYQRWLTPDQFAARFGAGPAKVKAIQNEFAALGLQAEVVTGQHLHVTGTAAAVEKAFGTELQIGQFVTGRTKVVATRPMLPTTSLVDADAVLTGFAGTIRMRAHSHRVGHPQNRDSITGLYWYDDLKQAYSFPSYLDYTGKGATIGILMSGDFNPPDMDLYFGHEKLATPNIKTVNVDGGAPYDPDNSFETHLDLQQSGGMAPKAKIRLYNLPDLSDDSIIDGLSKTLSENKADVVSMSFGIGEIFYTAAYNGGTSEVSLMRVEDDLMAQGNAQGITFVASSGDSGALGAVPLVCFNGGPNCGAAFASASFPATSPHVVAVGGTNLVTTHSNRNLNSKYVREEAYADPLDGDIFFGTSATGNVWGSGGGDSTVFRKPAFQNGIRTGNDKFRTIPDLSLHMGGCPLGATEPCNPDDSADYVTIDGGLYGVVGTSASAPDFAGLIALLVERAGSRVGNANFYIYQLALAQSAGLPIGVFNTGIPGYNGLYSTTAKGYNRVLGNGTVNGLNFLIAPTAGVAGTPQTPSNP